MTLRVTTSRDVVSTHTAPFRRSDVVRQPLPHRRLLVARQGQDAR